MSSTQDGSPRPVLINKPLKWTDWALSEQAKALRLVEDDKGNIWAYPALVAGLSAFNEEINIAAVGANGDTTMTATNALHVRSLQYVYNIDTDRLERQRTPTFFKYGQGTDQAKTVHSPAGGKSLRIQGFSWIISKDAACAGAQFILLSDSLGTYHYAAYLSSGAMVATGQQTVITVNFPGNGLLLGVNVTIGYSCNGAWSAGGMAMNVWGTEE